MNDPITGREAGPITLDRVRKTYNGRTGCACGCGGDYYVPTGRKEADYDVENDRAVSRRVAQINQNLGSVEVWLFGDEWCYEVVTAYDADGDPSRCTRVYVDAPAEQAEPVAQPEPATFDNVDLDDLARQIDAIAAFDPEPAPLTLDTARMVTLDADPLLVVVYEGKAGAVSCTRLPGFDSEWLVEFARYTYANEYDAGWRYVGTVPNGDSARVLGEFYLNVQGW